MSNARFAFACYAVAILLALFVFWRFVPAELEILRLIRHRTRPLAIWTDRDPFMPRLGWLLPFGPLLLASLGVSRAPATARSAAGVLAFCLAIALASFFLVVQYHVREFLAGRLPLR